ncbi:family 43 glycosylhydrolase [uncultured Sphingobacterium sp.]|uniref:family 43 glycosylhydrolase n=1 Tax=uncultured Sphingobacterium sp. TaxID=182688 RepID=UPI003747A5CD
MKSILSWLLLLPFFVQGQVQGQYNAIYSGVPWIDAQGKTVSARGACIIKEKDTYFLFGEYKTDSANVFNGFSCYSSKDLVNWRFESMALPVQSIGKLGPNRVGERPKVMQSPTTGEYIMYMHVDSLNYKDQFVGYATASKITGPYQFQGPLLYNGQPIRRWDMGSFQDDDGRGYILIHGGEIYRLGADYKHVEKKLNETMVSGFESPTMLKKDGLYYFLGSNLTSWERNDNYYYTSRSLAGPWEKQGFFAPEGSLTWNSQCTFVLPIQGTETTFWMYMGDRWSFPKQNSAGSYVWQPLSFEGNKLLLPHFYDAWQLDLKTGEYRVLTLAGVSIDLTTSKEVIRKVNWKQDSLHTISSDRRGDQLTMSFHGRAVTLYGLSRPTGGYAKVTIENKKGQHILTSIVDMYALVPNVAIKFASPQLKEDTYTIAITVMGEQGTWSDKRKNNYGSRGFDVVLQKFLVTK